MNLQEGSLGWAGLGLATKCVPTHFFKGRPQLAHLARNPCLRFRFSVLGWKVLLVCKSIGLKWLQAK